MAFSLLNYIFLFQSSSTQKLSVLWNFLDFSLSDTRFPQQHTTRGEQEIGRKIPHRFLFLSLDFNFEIAFSPLEFFLFPHPWPRTSGFSCGLITSLTTKKERVSDGWKANLPFQTMPQTLPSSSIPHSLTLTTSKTHQTVEKTFPILKCAQQQQPPTIHLQR